MIEYVAIYEEGILPKLCKKIDIDNLDPIFTEITVSNKSELENVPNEVIQDHLNNLVLFIKYSALSLSITRMEDIPQEGWPLNGWHDLSHTNDSLSEWWNFIYYREEPEDSEGSV
jgi:hypothetical protein